MCGQEKVGRFLKRVLMNIKLRTCSPVLKRVLQKNSLFFEEIKNKIKSFFFYSGLYLIEGGTSKLKCVICFTQCLQISICIKSKNNFTETSWIRSPHVLVTMDTCDDPLRDCWSKWMGCLSSCQCEEEVCESPLSYFVIAPLWGEHKLYWDRLNTNQSSCSP